MDTNQVSDMRLKQAGTINMLILVLLALFFLIVNVFTLTFSQFYLTAGIIVLIQGLSGLIKRDSTRSIFPILQQAAQYEKEKMGNEWYKYKRTGHIWSLVLGCMFILQSVLFSDSGDGVFQLEIVLMLIIAFTVFIMINISLIIHFRKVDQASTPVEFQGYTRKTYAVAFGVGIALGVLLIIFFVSLFLS
ncbi:hypothetical protein [Bacillus mesophilum]|uniref:Uncharacterized protein n=1 Tax=Bacillus mesophilum TaxID=1071718 RepID=A0A7V7UX45_9BACI|nr:hypothetical protein [Bacillus mesophilum]KAB2331971.1 hypothetical protein F7732_15030 [Bacillus mesophilum]